MNFMTEAFNKPAYDLTYEEKFVGMDYIWYFQDGNQEYKLHFEKQIGLGKKVFRVMLGQRTPGTKAYKKVVTKFRDPFRVVATVLEATTKFLDAQSGKAYGLAYGLPIAAFGAYKSMIAKVIQRKLMTRVELTDISFQPPKAEEDGLYYIYMTIKPHTIKQTFDGKWFDAALIDAAKPMALQVGKAGDPVDPTAVVPTAPAPTPAPAPSQKPGASAEFYIACTKMTSAKEFQELKTKFGVGADFSYKKFGAEVFKKGSTFKWFSGWDVVEKEILATIPSDDDKAMFRAYAVRQFFYQDPTVDNFLSMKDTIKSLNKTSTYSTYAKVIQPITEELLGGMVSDAMDLIKGCQTALEVLEAAKSIKARYKEAADFDAGFGERYFISKMNPLMATQPDKFMTLKVIGFICSYTQFGKPDSDAIKLALSSYGGFSQAKFQTGYGAHVSSLAVDKDNPLVAYFKGMSRAGITSTYQIDFEVNDPSIIKEIVIGFMEDTIRAKSFADKIALYVKSGGTVKTIIDLMANEKPYSGAISRYRYFVSQYALGSYPDAEEVLLAEVKKSIANKALLDSLSAESYFTDLYIIYSNRSSTDLVSLIPEAYVRWLKSNMEEALKFAINVSGSYSKASTEKFAKLVDWTNVASKIIFDRPKYDFSTEFTKAIVYFSEYGNGPLPRTMQKDMVAPLLASIDTTDSFKVFPELWKLKYIDKDTYNDCYETFIRKSVVNNHYLFKEMEDEDISVPNKVRLLNRMSGLDAGVVNHNAKDLNAIFDKLINSELGMRDFQTGIAGERNVKLVREAVKYLDQVNGKFDRKAIDNPYLRLIIAYVTKEEKEIKEILSARPAFEDLANNKLWSKGCMSDLQSYFDALTAIFGYSKAAEMFSKAASTEEKSRGSITYDEWEAYRGNFADVIGYTRHVRPSEFDTVYDSLMPQAKKLVAKKAIEASFIKLTHEAIFGDGVPIKPLMKLTLQRTKEILSYNRIDIPSVRIVKEFDSKELTNRINKATTLDIPGLNVTEVPKTEEELKSMSVEYDFYNKGMHGDLGIKILKVFDVSIPIQETGYEEFMKENPGTRVVSPAFHGTGSVAASMILRKGFAVLKAGDASVVGRMLGDGIYFSTVLDKVGQYVSDGGYSRGIGNKGYIFEMDAALGESRINYRAAGTGTDDTDGKSVISPEWCVFDGNRQLKIRKAYMIELVKRAEIKSYSIKEHTNIMPVNHFDAFLREARNPKATGAITYTFMDGSIPLSKDNKVDFEEFKESAYKGLRIEISAIGPMVVFDSRETEGYAVRSTREFQNNTIELNRFLKLLKAAKK